jgi:hypothetical protein
MALPTTNWDDLWPPSASPSDDAFPIDYPTRNATLKAQAKTQNTHAHSCIGMLAKRAAANTRWPTQATKSPTAMGPTNNKLQRLRHPPSPRLQARPNTLTQPAFARQHPTNTPITDAGRLEAVMSYCTLLLLACRNKCSRHIGTRTPPHRPIPARRPRGSAHGSLTFTDDSHIPRAGTTALPRHSATPPLCLSVGDADSRHTAKLNQAVQAFDFTIMVSAPSGK